MRLPWPPVRLASADLYGTFPDERVLVAWRQAGSAAVLAKPPGSGKAELAPKRSDR